MTTSALRWIKYVTAVIIGNLLYFILRPHLPPAAQQASHDINWGTVVDFWLCLFVYGIIELFVFLRGRNTD